MKKKIIVATRPSQLAYTQTKQTVSILEQAHPHIHFEIVKISTQGDRNQKSSLTTFGGTGVFVKELEYALLEGTADIAIHSLKDMPSLQPKELCLVAFPKREDPRDMLVTTKKSIQTVGTGSPRRLLQCALQYPNVSFIEMRGNVQTRLDKMEQGLCDATYLAAAGLKRLNLTVPNAIPLSVQDFIPAIGQGALAIECRTDDIATQQLVATVNHLPTYQAVQAERAFMKEIQGGCKFPLAAHAYLHEGKLRFLAIIGDLKSMQYIKHTMDFNLSTATEQATTLAKQMRQECQEQNINFKF